MKQIVNKVLTDSEGAFPFFTKLQTGVTMSANTAKRNPSMRTMRALLLRGASGGALTLLLATTPVRAQLSAFNAALGHNIGGAATAAQVGSVMPTLTPTMNQIIARHTQYQQIVQNQAAIIASANSAAREAARAAAQSVPNGLVKGGLEAAVTVKVTNLADIAGNGLNVWQGADLPTQSVTAATGAVDVTVNQTDSRALLSWNSFNVGRDTTLTFNQQGHSDWVAVNRVVGGINPDTGLLDPARSPTPSQILGKIKADGTVYVLNRSGILFGATAQVDLHSLVASSLELGQTIVRDTSVTTGAARYLSKSVKELNDAYLQNGILPAEHVGLLGYIKDEFHGDVTVARGAQIASSGGFVIIAAPKVTMAGEINPATDASGNARTQVPGGQVSLVAGTLVDAVVATGATGSVDPNVRGLVLASTGGGTVDVSGSINAPQGYISLVTDTKGTVNLSGILSSTTSVSRNGKISLIGGSVNMLSQSVQNANGNADIQHGTIAITADTSGDTIPQSADSIAAFKRSQVEIGNFYVQTGLSAFGQIQSIDLSDGSFVDGALNPTLFPSLVTIGDNAMIHAPSADVNVGGTANGSRHSAATTTGITKSGITIGANAVIDVSGLDSIQLAAIRNQLTIAPAKKNELRDTPTYREVTTDGGFTLNGATLYVDARASGVRSDGVAWVGSPLLEAGSLAAQIGVTAPELMTRGGNVTLATLRRDGNTSAGAFPSAVDIASRATIDFAGGWVNYAPGFIRSSKLITADGRIVDISAANPNDRFTGIAGGFVQNLPQLSNPRIFNNPLTIDAVVSEAYAEGRDAGSLTVSAPTMSINGSFHGDAVAGSRQISGAQVPTTASALAADPRMLQAVATQLPSSGFLHVDAINLGSSILYGGMSATGADGSPKIQIGQSQLDAIAGLIHITEPTINNANLSALSLQSSGAVIFAKDSQLTLQPGGTLNVDAGRTISFNGSISVPAGTIAARTYAIQQGDIFDDRDNLATGDALRDNYLLSGPIAANCAEPGCTLPAWQTLMASAGDPSIAAQAPGWFDIVVSPDASLSARGLWTNDFLVGADGFTRGAAYTSGGSVSLTVAPHVAVTTAAATKAVDISGSILLRPDSLIDVSGGGYVAPTGGLSLNGKGGNVSLIDETVYFQLLNAFTSVKSTKLTGSKVFQLDYTSFQLGPDVAGGTAYFQSSLVPDEIRSKIDIAQGASIRGFGFKGGGTFKLVTPDLAFNDPTGAGTQIPLDFLNRTGFGTLDLSVWKTAIFDNVFANGEVGKTALMATKLLTIGAGDMLNLTQTILPTILTPTQSAVLRAQTSDTDITRLDTLTPSNTLGDYDNLAANIVLGGVTELDLLAGGTITGAAGATITAPKLYVAGNISIRGGSITQSEFLPLQSLWGVGQWSGGQSVSIEAALAEVFGQPDANGKFDQKASIVGAAAAQFAQFGPLSVQNFLTKNTADHQIYLLGRLAQDQGILFTAASTTDLSGGFIQNPRASVTAGGTQVAAGRLIDGGTVKALGRFLATRPLFSSAKPAFGASPYKAGESNDVVPTAQRPEQRIDAETGAKIDLSGASATLDLQTSGQALTPTLVGTKAGTMSGLGGGDISGATLLAKAGTASAQGGTFEWYNPVLQQNAGSGLPGAGANGNIVFADQLSLAGFDSFVARGALSTNGDVTLSLGRSFLLSSPGSLGLIDSSYYASSINGTGDLIIQAPHIALTSIAQKFSAVPAGTGKHDLILRAEATSGTGASFDIAGAVEFGGGFGDVTLSSQGDIRLIGVQPIDNTLDPSATVLTPSLTGGIVAAGNLTLQARQVYATTGTGNLLQDPAVAKKNANASVDPFIIASLANSVGNAPTVTFRAEPGSTASTPYSAGSYILVAGESILQDGVLQAPLGRIDLGGRTGFQLTDLGQTITTNSLTLTGRSVTSVSAEGLNIPFGVTTDGTEYYFRPTMSSALSVAPAAQLGLSAGTITTEPGATVDASGGGSIYAYEFVSGTGGSRDVLSRFNSDSFSSTNGYQYADGRQVYAILPADSPELAALYDPIYSSDYADLYGANVGKAVQLDAVAATADRPAIAAGTYILLPAKYALLPGAMRLVENVGAAAPLTDSALRLLDNSVLVGGVYSIAGTDIADTVRRSFTVQTKDVFTQYSQINTTDAASYFRGKAALNSLAIPRLPNDAARIVIDPGTGLSIGSRFNTSAKTDEDGNKGRGSQVDILGDVVNIVSSMDNAGPSGVNLLADSLVNLNAESLLIGGTRKDEADGSTGITVSASEIHVRNFSSDAAQAAQTISLTVPEIILAVQGPASILDIADNAVISATGTLTDTRNGVYDLTTSDSSNATARVGTVGSLLRVANGAERLVDRIGNTDPGIRNNKAFAFTIGAATIAGQSLTLDSSRDLDMDAANLDVQNLALGSETIAFSKRTFGVKGFIISPELEAKLSRIARVTLYSPNSIGFAPAVAPDGSDSTHVFRDLVLDTPGLRLIRPTFGKGRDPLSVTIDAGNLTLRNSFADTGVCTNSGLTACNATGNSLTLNAAGTLSLQSGTFRTYGFDKAVAISALAGTYYSGKGSLALGTAGLTLATPFIADLGAGTVPKEGAEQPNYEFNTASSIAISAPSASTAVAQTALLAPSARFAVHALNDTGAPGLTIADTVIRATAGTIDLQAQGDITLSGAAALEAPSYRQAFGPKSATGQTDPDQVTISASAGSVGLISRSGNIAFTSSGSTAPHFAIGGASGGSGRLSLLAAEGSIDLGVNDAAGFTRLIDAASPNGGAGLAFDSGKSGFAFDTFVTALGSQFTGDIAIRSSLGDLVLNAGQSLKATSVNLTSDGGSTLVNGRIDTSGINGGAISLYARDNVSLGSGAVLDAHSTGYALDDTRRAEAGDVILGISGDGAISVASGATIDLGVIAARAGNTDGYRAIGHQQTDPVTHTQITSYTVVEGDGGGTFTLRAPIATLLGGDGINFAGTIAGTPSGISVVGYRRYDLDRIDTSLYSGVTIDGGVATLDVGAAVANKVNFLADETPGADTIPNFIQKFSISDAVEAKFGNLTSFGSLFHEKPGVELAYSGTITLASNWNLGAGRITDPEAALDDGYLSVSPLSKVVGTTVYSVTPGKEADLFQNYVHMLYRTGTGANTGGEAGAFTLRAGGDLNLKHSISDGFFNFADQTDSTYLTYQLGGGTLLFQPTFTFDCGADGCNNLAALPTDFSGKTKDLPPARNSLSFALKKAATETLLGVTAPYSDTANAAAAFSNGTAGGGDPFGGAQLFPLLTVTDGAGNATTRAVASSDIQFVAGAGAGPSANPLHIDRGAEGSVTLSGSTSYDLSTSGKATGLYFGETLLQSNDYGNLQLSVEDLASFRQIFSDYLKKSGGSPAGADDLASVTTRINLGADSNLINAARTFVQAHSDSAVLLGTAKTPTGLATTLDLAIAFLTSTNAIELLGNALVGQPITGGTGGRVIDAGTVIAPSLVRTGTGRIDVAAALNVDLRNGDEATLHNDNLGKIGSGKHPLYQLGGTAIYTAGHVVIPHSTTIGGLTVDPAAYLPAQIPFSKLWEPDLNGRLQANPVFATGGGAITVEAGNDILGRRDVWNEVVGVSASGAHKVGGIQRNFTNIAMYGAGDQRWRVGAIGSDPADILGSTYIRVNPQAFTSGIATLGGGDVSLHAGGDLREMTTALDTTLASADVGSSFGAMVFGGGDLDVFVGGQVAGGRFDISTGIASITAAEDITSSGYLAAIPDYGQATQMLKTIPQYENLPEIRLTDTQLSLEAGGSITLAAVSALGVSSENLNSLGYYTGTSGVSAVSNGNFSITGGPSMPASILASDGGLVTSVAKVLPASLDVTSFGGNIDLGELNSFLYPSATGQLSLRAGGTLAEGSAITLDDSDPSLLPGLHSAFATDGAARALTLFGHAFYLPSILPNSSDATRRLYHYNVFAQTRDSTPVRIAVGGDLSELTLYAPKQARVSAEGDIVNMIFVGQNLSADDATRIVAGRDITSTTKVSTTTNNVFGDTNGRIISQGSFFALGGAGSFFVEAGRDLGPFLNSATISGFSATSELSKTPGTLSFAGGILAVGNDYNPWLAPKSADIYAFFGIDKGMDFAALADTYVNPANVAALPGDLFEQKSDLFGNKSPDRTRPVYGPILIAWMQQNQGALLNSLYGTANITVQQAYDAFASLSELTQRRFLLDKVYFNELAAPSQPAGNSYLQYGRGYRAVEALFPSSLGYTSNDTTGASNGAARDSNNVPQLQHSGNLDLRLAAIQTTRDSNITLLGPGGNAILGSVIRTSAQADGRAYQPFIFGSYGSEARPTSNGSGPNDTAFPVLSIPTGYEGMLTLRGGAIHSFTDGDLRLNQSRLFTQDSGDIILWSSNGDLNAGQGPKSAANVPPIVLRFNPNGGSEVDSAAGVVGAGIAAFAGIRRLERDGAALADAAGDPDAASALTQLAALPLGTSVIINGKSYRFALTDAPNDSTVAGASAQLSTLSSGTITTIGGKTYQRDLPTIYLLAPAGTVDAGDAGVRAGGNIFIAAAQVANADNFKVGGTAIGIPSVGSAPAAALPSGAASALVANVFKTNASDFGDQKSRITVDVEGFYSFDSNSKDADSNNKDAKCNSNDCAQ